MSGTSATRDPLTEALSSALLWTGAFCYAIALFLPAYKILRLIRPGAPVAIGRVTIEGVAKSSEYAYAILFYLAVPLLTVLLRRGLGRLLERASGAAAGSIDRLASAVVVSLPLVAAPFLFLTTNKEGWGAILPLLLALAGSALLRIVRTRRWIRSLLAPDLRPFHALVLLAAGSWIVFRYLAVGAHIAHIPTLLLEIPFVALFGGAFWIVTVCLARAAAFARGRPIERSFRGIALGSAPLLALPLIPLFSVTLLGAATVIVAAGIAGMVAGAFLGAGARAAPRVRAGVALFGIPLLLFVIGWASNAHLTGWIDLFHRGESLGPASEYLRGEVPYRDTFVLHGMLEDGFLDAALMTRLGRDADVAAIRTVTMSVLSIVALWMLALVAFDSIPLALAVVALGSTTFVENPRALMELVVAAILLAALWRRSLRLTAAAGAVSSLALFYSLDIGIYAFMGSIATALVWTIWTRERPGLRPAATLASYLAGAVAGAAPFVLWLAAHGALADFARTSFVDVPRVIDAVWSLPFPDLDAVFRRSLSLPALADLVLGPTARFILNPLVLGIAAVMVLARLRSAREPDRLDLALLLLTAFGVITQRSALGRADFQHQYFSAFLIAPLLVAFAVAATRAARKAWREREPRARVILSAAAVAAAAGLAALLWVPDLLATRLDAVIGYRARVAGTAPDAIGATLNDRIDHVVAAIRRWSPPGGSIFDFSNQPAFYFFADRRNPTRFFQIPIASPPAWQLEVIRDLERERPAVALRGSPEGYDWFDGVPNEVRAQAIAAYLDAHYDHRRTVRGVEIWIRNDAGMPDLRALAAAIHVPGDVPPRRERLALPMVSGAGAGGAAWVSALIVHNPHETAAELRLRYASNQGTTDAVLPVAPGELRVVRDAPRSLFRLHDSVGVLWVEEPAERPLLIAAETHDRSRAAVASRALPFSLADAATAGQEKSVLTIAGVQGGAARRINVGAVNFGLVPARVRIQAHGPGGAPAGTAFEMGVAEETSWVLVDAGTRLGVSFEAPMTIRITALEGTVVGYASVVDGATGIHEMLRGFPTRP